MGFLSWPSWTDYPLLLLQRFCTEVRSGYICETMPELSSQCWLTGNVSNVSGLWNRLSAFDVFIIGYGVRTSTSCSFLFFPKSVGLFLIWTEWYGSSVQKWLTFVTIVPFFVKANLYEVCNSSNTIRKFNILLMHSWDYLVSNNMQNFHEVDASVLSAKL